MIEKIDFTILNLIQNLRCDIADNIFSFITHLGDMGIIWIAIGVTLLFFKKYRKCGVMMLVSLLVCAILTSGVIKPLVGRVRPFQIAQITPYITPPGGFSFPSGHTSSSFTAAFSLFLVHKKEGIAAFVLATLIAFSRLYFYVHFPTDVLVGAILGILCAFLVNKLLSKSLKML